MTGTAKKLDVCIGWLDEFSMFRGPALKTTHLTLDVPCPICLQNVQYAYDQRHENQEHMHATWKMNYNAVLHEARQQWANVHGYWPEHWMAMEDAERYRTSHVEPLCPPQHAQIFGWSEIDC